MFRIVISSLRAMKNAALNLVQCNRSSEYLAKLMEERFGIPYLEVNFFGVENCCEFLFKIGEFFDVSVEDKVEEGGSKG